MALKTKIIVQQILNIDDTKTTASKYPKYTVVLGTSISSITASELTAAVEASAASAAAAKDSEIAAKESEINAKDSENLSANYANSSEASATQSATSATEAERQAGLSKDSADASAISAEESKGFRDSAELAAQNAEQSRLLAEQAKKDAEAAKTAAATSEQNAATSATESTNQAIAAAGSATEAGEYATTAKDSEIAAKTSELNAKNSENESAISAEASEASASQSAISASQSAASATKAAESSAAAKISETTAIESSAAAKTSETNAKTSETNAKTSETNAAAYAAAAKTSETNAADSAASASDSKGFRDEAEAFATQASTSALAAKNSETSTKTSESNSKASEAAAKLAQQGASDSANTATQAMTTTKSYRDEAEGFKNTATTAATTATDKALEAASSATIAEQKAATATSEADRSKTEADRAATESANAKGWKYERTVNAPAGVENEKYYPVVFQEKNAGDMMGLGVFFQISTKNESGTYPYNSASFAGYARTSGWSDGVDSIYGNFTIYHDGERTMDCIVMPAELTTKAFAVYVRGGAFPVRIHCESNIDVIVPTSDYAPDGFVEHATVFKFGAADPAAECTQANVMGLTHTGFYAVNDYIIRHPNHIREQINLGEKQIARFTSLDLIRLNSPEISGTLNLHARGVDPNTSLGYSRVYAEKQNGVWKTTFHTANNETDRHSYIQHDEYGNIHNVFNLYPVNVDATGFIRGGGSSVGLKTKDGGKKDIFLYNLEGDGDYGYMVNQMQGWFYGSSYQLGGIRSSGASLESVDLVLNSFYAGESARFSFRPSYGGHIVSPYGFNGSCKQGAWGLEWDHMGSPFHANMVTNNDAGWSPIVSGGSSSTGGYAMRVGLGVMSQGNNAWPSTALKINGDGRYHRAYNFDHMGGIYTWGNDPWGGNFDFAKNPTSDRDLKHDIQYTEGKESYDRVMQWLPTMFKYNGTDIQRYGLIAQDLAKIDLQYVKLVPGSPVFEDVIGVDADGNEYVDRQIETDRADDTLALDSNVVLTDMACAMVYMGNQLEQQRKELDELKKLVSELITPDNS
ncbi:tail fiber domain-containing protein [Citrobacter freundii]|uniref:tail fiber domain-containing protein n=1 Tax=Citrobacter freundii TaxID=546 RepID=UPI003A987F42